MISEDSTRSLIFVLAGTWLLYGLYIPLFSTAIIILLRRRRKHRLEDSSLSLSYRGHLAAIISLFILATAGLVVGSIEKEVNVSLVLVSGAGSSIGSVTDAWTRLVLRDVLLVIYLLENIIADIVLIHRCYIIWDSRKRAIIIPVLVSLMNHTYAIVSIIIDTPRKPLSPTAPFPKKATIAQIVFLGINALAHTTITALIAGRIWWITRKARTLMGAGSDSDQLYRTVIAIVLESGILYSSSLVFGLIISALTVEDATTDFSPLLIQIVGIAPTLIIVRSSLGISVESTRTQTHITTLRFAAPPAEDGDGLRRSNSIPPASA